MESTEDQSIKPSKTVQIVAVIDLVSVHHQLILQYLLYILYTQDFIGVELFSEYLIQLIAVVVICIITYQFGHGTSLVEGTHLTEAESN